VPEKSTPGGAVVAIRGTTNSDDWVLEEGEVRFTET